MLLNTTRNWCSSCDVQLLCGKFSLEGERYNDDDSPLQSIESLESQFLGVDDFLSFGSF